MLTWGSGFVRLWPANLLGRMGWWLGSILTLLLFRLVFTPLLVAYRKLRARLQVKQLPISILSLIFRIEVENLMGLVLE